MKHKVSFILVLFAILLMAAVYMLSAQNIIKLGPGATAERALITFKKSVTEKNYKNYGLKTAKSAATARLGNPIEVSAISLNDLKEYRAGQAKKIINPTNRVIYPLLSPDNAVISAIEFDFVGGQWQARSFGNTNEAEAYEANLTKIKKDATQETFLIRIPSLALEFLGVEKAGKTYLTYLGDQVFDSITPGMTLPLEDVIIRIQPSAKQYNGLPR